MTRAHAAAEPGAHQAYRAGLEAADGLFGESERFGRRTWSALSDAVDGLIAALTGDGQEILTDVARTTPARYLPGHSVNVAVLSLRIGLSLGKTREELWRLGMAGMLHDIGLAQCLRLVFLERRLTATELGLLRGRARQAARIIVEAPGGDALRRAEVAELLRRGSPIIELCDAYESLSHSRTWRGPALPHAAVKEVLRFSRRDYQPSLIRHFVRQVGLYPPGSYVQLASGDIGCVVRVHPESPLRPTVKFIFDGDGLRLRHPWYVDLQTQPRMHIERALGADGLKPLAERLRRRSLRLREG